MPDKQPWTFVDSAYQHYLRWAGIPVEYDVRSYSRRAAVIKENTLKDRSDDELRGLTRELREQARCPDAEPSGSHAAEQAVLDSLLPQVFALGAEVAARTLNMRPYDVQVAAGIALHEGKVAQLKTGEGKTLVAVLPAVLNALTGRGVHVFTANDYLARRDAEWMAPVYRFFGLEPAYVVEGMGRDERRRAYASHVTYVTAKEAGFDYLRDNVARDRSATVRRPPNFVIVDEADFILIDEARVPLVIAGSAPSLGIHHAALADLVRRLRRGADFDADEYQRTVVLTEAGFRTAGRLLGGLDLNREKHHLLLSAIHVALHAEVLLHRDRDYIVRDGRVELVDEFTGRVADNRRWPHGIQAAVEAKEGVGVRPEGAVLGSIPIQHFVRQYPKIAGMTATAVPAAQEFDRFFDLRTVVFPPNRQCERDDEDDAVFTDRTSKNAAVIGEIRQVHETGRPILVGTASVAESEALAAALVAGGIGCQVLNARHDSVEAKIIARAGELGAVTISTNMAGRGTDILLGAGDAAMREKVLALGGLYVIGTNRHESVRIDDQLRGRAGRQGDPGTSRFFISLQDDLISRYGVMKLIPKAHLPKPGDRDVDDPVVRREIARAQRIIEGQNFDIRRTLWRYSQMVEDQRRILYEQRQALLLDECDAEVCETEAADRFEALASEVGDEKVRLAARQVMIHVIDRAWANHLALVEDIREGIHLQRLGGREPLTEFSRQIIEAFRAMMESLEDEALDIFRKLRVREGEIDLAGAGVAGSSTTWTYLVDDNPFSNLGMSLLASRTLTSTVGILAVMYWPITLVVSTVALLRRLRAKSNRDPEQS